MSVELKEQIEQLREHAGLGQPLPARTRLRVLKRLIFRVSRPFLHHQRAYNLSAVAAFEALERIFEALERDAEDRIRHVYEQRQGDIAQIGSELTALQLQIDRLKIAIGVVQDDREREASQLRMLRGQANVLLDRVRRALPEPIDLEPLREERPSAWQEMASEFEKVFRGEPSDVKALLAPYVDDVRGVERQGRPVLDVGPGRGEWLQLLASADIDAYGIDTDENFVREGRQRGLDIRAGDAIGHLSQLEPESIGVITAFHLVEHLPFDDLLRLLDLSLQALVRGGLLILETPNPENLVVGSESFYLDPTHNRPLPPALLSFLVGSRGFSRPEVRRLRRNVPDPVVDEELVRLGLPVSRLLGLLQDRLLAGEDYAVVAHRV